MNSKATIAHSVSPYLFLTGSWIYGQIVNLKRYCPVVITNKIENLNLFPFQTIYSFEDLPKVKQFIYRIRRKLFREDFYDYYYKVLKKNKSCIIHSHFGYQGFDNLSLAKRLKIPHIASFYGADVSQVARTKPLWINRYKTLFKECDLFIAEGNFLKKSLVKLGCPEDKIAVNHLGVDLIKIPFIPRKLNKKDEKIKILVAGTFRQKKGIPYAIKAFARLSKKFAHMELKIVGDATTKPGDKEEKSKILSLIRECNISSKVELFGFISPQQLHKIAKGCHIFLSPSIQADSGDSEGGAPVTLIEMSAAGMPVISTYHCDIPEVVIDGETGLLTKERDVGGITDRLEYLIKNSGIWEKMGKMGRDHINKEFNILKQIPKLESIYSELL